MGSHTYDIQKTTDISYLVAIAVENEDALEVKAQYDSDIVANSHVQGFRKGKAPLHVVINKIGREKYWKDVREFIASKALTEALKDKEISPIVKPSFEFADWEEGGKFVFTATVYTEPPDPADKAIKPDLESPPEPIRVGENIQGIPGDMPIIDGKVPPALEHGPQARPRKPQIQDREPAPVNIPEGDPSAPIHKIPKRPDEQMQSPEQMGAKKISHSESEPDAKEE